LPTQGLSIGRRNEADAMTKQKAIILDDHGLSTEGRRIAKILDFLGVAWRSATTTELLTLAGADREISSRCRLFCSSDVLLQLIERCEDGSGRLRFWEEEVHSVFAYSGGDREVLLKLVQRLTGDSGAMVSKIKRKTWDIIVSKESDDFCGVMSGVRATTTSTELEADVVLNNSKGIATSIISLDHGAVFLRIEYNRVPIFLLTSKEIVDIDSELTSQNFDVRPHFLEAVPVVLYIKWALAETCWNAPKTTACLVIDDPVLKSRHGFVNFRELLFLMKEHNFSTNIAFIPWNWRRTTPEVIRLFKENPENYSLSVHGCDHTRAEFGSSDQRHLYWKAQLGLERMNRHQRITGIPHDRVMVFPQGIFSEAAMNALKRTDLIAAINNDVISADLSPRALSLAELWDIAIMGYGFPLFTRRYPWEGIENFAFDALLGKPAIIVIHHDYCSDGCLRLVQFVDQLNSLKDSPAWQSLGEVVRHSYRQRQLSSSQVEIEMYATELQLENRTGQSKSFLIRRRECEPSLIREVCDGSGTLAWNFANGYIGFETTLSAGESKLVNIKFHHLAENGGNGNHLRYRFGVMLRRYLCEIRDNYITTAKLRVANRLASRDQKSEVRTR
jgi:hypothetical protein